MKPVITVENISKSYQITHQNKPNYSTLKDDLSSVLKKPFGGGSNKTEHEKFWALKDISFEVNKGEIFGIVGKNGSGKSTLLKILSRTVDPTTGVINIHGRVASMLEVGTGFHPELTGRENVYFNGSMLGMSKSEIDSKFDAIIKFSEVEKFLDTPVKFYSSGMYVRLAFSVAAHLEPDILIIDEVLAVGDAAFQKKCMTRIAAIARSGKTVLFVSHSMAVVRQLCSRAMFLEKGVIKYIGETEFATEQYMARNIPPATETHYKENLDKTAQFTQVEVQGTNGEKLEKVPANTPWQLRLDYEVREKLTNTIVGVEVLNSDEQPVFMTSSSDLESKVTSLEPGKYSAIIPFKDFSFVPGVFYLRVSIQTPGKTVHDVRDNIPLKVSQDPKDVRLTYFNGKYMGFISDKIAWEVTKK